MDQVATDDEQVENLVEIMVIDFEEDEMEMKGSSSQDIERGVERTSFHLEEIASEAIREMQEIERKRNGKLIGNQEGPALETQDEAKVGDEEVTVPAKWKRRIEETVEGLVAENETQRTLTNNYRACLIINQANPVVWPPGSQKKKLN